MIQKIQFFYQNVSSLSQIGAFQSTGKEMLMENCYKTYNERKQNTADFTFLMFRKVFEGNINKQADKHINGLNDIADLRCYE